MSGLIYLVLILGFIGLAFKNLYLVGVLILLYFVSAPTSIVILTIFLYFLYQNDKVKAWVDLHIQKFKLKQDLKNNQRRSIEYEIKNFKSNAISAIKHKYSTDITISKSDIKILSQNHGINQKIKSISDDISELKFLIKDLKEDKSLLP